MPLKKLIIERSYKNLSCDMVNDFYVPILSEGIEYKRAVGFFTSSAFCEISYGIQNLIKNNGNIKLIVSPNLTEDDVKAINKGYKQREQIVTDAIMREFTEPKNFFEQRSLNLLANLIAMNKLDIKVAFKHDEKQIGIYHEKIGIVIDEENNKVAFTGSMNETSSALLNNYESIDVFCSWRKEDVDRVIDKNNDFDMLWANYHSKLNVIPFPKVAIEKLTTYKVDTNIFVPIPLKTEVTIKLNPEQMKERFFTVPNGFKFHQYQQDAIDKWLEKDSKGIYDMATGTGKTYTALGSLTVLSEKLQDDNLFVIILCPYQHLVEQWVEDIELFNVSPLICYSKYDWEEKLKSQIRYFNNRITKRFCLITTNDSFAISKMQKLIETVKGNICLVVDEAHNFGAKSQRKLMNEKFKYRLALSATLDRKYDDEGTKALHDYFGNICIQYTLKEAIENDFLCHYKYYPIVVTLNSDELEEYNQLSERLSKFMLGKKSGGELPEAAKQLLMKRARIIAGAKNKIPALEREITPYKDKKNILVYCGAVHDDDKRQIEIVADLLGNKLNMKIAKFTAEEDKDYREVIKKDFAEGKQQAVVAIKCLDEGMNIPGIQTAFILASSTNPKEYVQRRGRVLRNAKGKYCAEIFDFITLPYPIEYDYVNPETKNYELSLIKREKERMEDFANLSDNPSAVDEILSQIKEKYNLNIIGEDDYEF